MIYHPRLSMRNMRDDLWSGRQKWISFFTSACVTSLALGYVIRLPFYGHFGTALMLHNLITTLLVFVLHICCSLDAAPVLSLIGGTFIGMLSGPLYILLNGIRRFRTSERWHNLTRGANFGFAITPGIFVYFFRAHLRGFGFLPYWSVSCLLYMLCVLLVHMTRSTRFHRSYWRTSMISFFTGFVFGPFCILFRRSFPEAETDELFTKQVQNARRLGNACLLIVVGFP